MHLGEIPSPLPNSLKCLEVLEVWIYLIKITDRVGNNISKPATPHQKLIWSVLRAIAKQQEHIFFSLAAPLFTCSPVLRARMDKTPGKRELGSALHAPAAKEKLLVDFSQHFQQSNGKILPQSTFRTQQWGIPLSYSSHCSIHPKGIPRRFHQPHSKLIREICSRHCALLVLLGFLFPSKETQGKTCF